MATIAPVMIQSPADPFVRNAEKTSAVVSEVAYLNGSSDSSGSSTPPSALDGNDVCIVGMACHLPGGISSPSDLWDLLLDKKSAQCIVPADRYNIKGFYHKDNGRAGAMNVDGGYFLQEDVRQFDNSFFGINNLEASYMDPQQRKLLEVVYECFEHAGVSMEEVSGSNTAVYVGNFTVDYQSMQSRDPDYLHRLAATGGGTSIMANRISHVFNLKGPSLTLDTACSSSIYALHHAVLAIRNGDCDGAIVAGANLITSPEQHLGTAKGGFLSPTSECHTFDTAADGYARAEGVNAIYVRRLSSALDNGNTVRGVIRGTAINANGKTPGITLPSATMQAAVVRKAYQNAGLDFKDTDFIECHGTGTAVGDPIELDGLATCFTAREGESLKIGSVKTNLGHSEAASGLTSIIKVALAFEHGIIPASYGVKNLNPKLKLEDRNMKVLVEAEPWPRALKRASINSFGYGGANGHVIVESFESYLGNSDTGSQISNSAFGAGNGNAALPKDEVFVLPFSAGSAKSLEIRRQQISDLALETSAEELPRLISSLGKREARLRLRDFLLLSASPKPLLIKTAEGAEKAVSSAQPLPFAFIFTGQGAQYAGMAKELLQQNMAFRGTIRELDQTLQSLPSQHAPAWTLEQTILDSAASSKVNEVTRSQPLCTAVQIALVDLLRSWGVNPSAVIGHSSGEIAASYSAGLLSAKQAILAAYFRGFTVGKLTARGTMMAAGVSADVANGLIRDQDLKEVRVACVNAPESVTLSGANSDIQALHDELQSQGKFARKLETGGRAYHSHMMAQVGDMYEQLVSPHLGPNKEAKNKPTIAKFFSTVGHSPDSVAEVDSSTNMAAYFRQNLEQPVQFSASLTSLITSGDYHLIEIGPHSALKGPAQQIRSSAERSKESTPYSATLVRKENANISLKTLGGVLFTHGHALDWSAVNSVSETYLSGTQRLPKYPWDYSKPLPWHEPRASVDIRNRKHIRHELLGTQTAAGNGIDWSWRNILRLSEMPWLKDHKLEAQVVLPGAAYISLAIEALSQIQTGLKDSLVAGEPISFEGQNINITTAFVVPEESDADSDHTELHTNMSQRKLSTANSSAEWYEFAVSSWVLGVSTLHCTGSIRVVADSKNTDMGPEQGSVLVNDEGYEVWSMGKWYEKTREEGLNFGPHFQSLTSLHTDGSRICSDAIATTQLDPMSVRPDGIFYAVHPITIDACIQASIMGGTAGNLSTLRAFVPVFVSKMRIQLPRGGGSSLDGQECRIHTRMEKTGFSTRQIDCTLRQPDGTPAIDLSGLRMALYTGKAPAQPASNLFQQRHPCLRVHWKPDILRLHPGSESDLMTFIRDFAARQSEDMRERDSLVVFGALLDLAGHKMPRMRVLELGDGCQCLGKECLEMLGKSSAFPRCRSWQNGSFGEEGELTVEDGKSSGPYDVILIPHYATTQTVWRQKPEHITSLLSERGVIISRKTDSAVAGLEAAGFMTIPLQSETLLSISTPKAKKLEGKEVLIVKPNKSSGTIEKFASSLGTHLEETQKVSRWGSITLKEIDQAKLSEEVVCISLLEVEHEFLATMSVEDMDRLRKITDTVTTLVWLTGGNMIAAPNPDLTLSNGLSRALMLEQPSLQFCVLDVGAEDLDDPETVTSVHSNVERALTKRWDTDDTEFIQLGKSLHVPRFAPDLELNSLFRQRLELNEPLRKATLEEIAPAKLCIGQVGMTDTMHFQQISESPTLPPVGFVEVNLKAISLNAKDIYAMSGRVETRMATTALDIAGVVAAVGPDVKHLKPGDRVAGLAPNHFGTTERVPAASVHKMLAEEEFTVVPTLLTVYSTALFALRDRAGLRKGESILIHAGAGAFGLAGISMAQHIGATVYTTVGSPAKREYLIKEMGVPASNIFNSRDASFVEGIKKATNGRGVDVIVNSLVGDLLHATWACIAHFGRFVEIGKKDLIDAGKLDMHVFLKNTTFTAFDLSEFFYAEDPHYRNVFYGLIAEAMDLYRAGKIKPGPIATFDVSDIAQAYRYFNNKDRVGKVVISMENPKSVVQVAPAKFTTVFDPKKSYLLVGCLGGLGRSLSRWMMGQGARKFVFVGRSGCDKPTARQLVDRLKNAGAEVTVVRGDVSSPEHVREAVAACVAAGPIGGVVQAAMGLREALFTVMPNEGWHIGIQPKWKGTWNLHNALEGYDKDMDFFLMTSSMSGSCGTATESNYCAANGFLDAFAHWRRAQGKPAVSLGLGMISEVGYLHENPEIEAMLLRKGIQPLNEDEFLQVLDYGLAGVGGEAEFKRRGPLAGNQAHILTGLEPFVIRKLMEKGFDVNNNIMEDPRMSVLAASLLAERDAKNAGNQGVDASQLSAAAAEWVKDVPAGSLAMFGSELSAPSMCEAILKLAKKRFSNLILMPEDQVDVRTPLPSFGVDSMLAAEFRTWFWNGFRIDVPFLDIVSPLKSLYNLAELVEEKMVASWAS